MRHPIATNRFQRRLAQTSWFSILLAFVIAAVALSGGIGVIESVRVGDLTASGLSSNAFRAFLAISDIGDPPEFFSKTSLSLLGILKIGLPAIVLGAAVYKLSIPNDVYVSRKKLVIKEDGEDGPKMIFRSYNATGMEAVSLQFKAYIRLSKVSDTGHSIENILVEPNAPSDTPPVMLPWVPHSVIIPLHPDDIDEIKGEKRLVSIQGQSCIPVRERTSRRAGDSYLLIIISGWLPALGTQFVEMESYRITGGDVEYEFGDFGSIDVLPPKGRLEKHRGKPKHWRGWKNFDRIM